MEQERIPSTGHLDLLCGKMASGKSTLAAELAGQQRAVLLCEDELLARLYPDEVIDIASYVELSGRIKQALRAHLVTLLRHGAVVVLDFPANTNGQRSWLKSLADDAAVPHTLHYLERSDAACIARLARRREEQPERRTTDTEAMFHAVTAYFQPPEESEGLQIRHHP